VLRRLKNRLTFELERFVVRSPLHRLLFIALLIAAVSLAAGLLARRTSAPFTSDADAIWWAFLRLTDPGYLGDDQGAGLRFISTIVTVLGYVLFLGALIAIMTQWLNATMARLESGLTPIAANDHIVIVGYSGRTAAIVKELLLSEERVARFLDARGARRLKIVILAERVDAQTVQDLKDRLGSLWRPRQIVLRSGTALRIEHLHRVDFLHAAAILLPSSEFSGKKTSTRDGQTIKALRATSISSRALRAERLPLVVAEVLDERHAGTAERAYGGPSEVLGTDALIARLLMQTVREPGSAQVYDELLAPATGNDIYIRRLPQLDGQAFATVARSFDEAIVVGVLRYVDGRPDAILAPAETFVVEEGDELVFVAKTFDACTPGRIERAATPSALVGPSRPPRPPRRVLILGWNHNVPAMLHELASDRCDGGVHEVDIVSSKAASERAATLPDAFGLVRVRQLEIDYAAPGEIARLEPARYDNIVFVASDRVDSPNESDARTLLGHLLLEEALAPADRRPSVVVELASVENVALLGHGSADAVVSSVIMSHILTQVALRRGLHAVYMELFGAGGAELVLRAPSDYGIEVSDLSFSEIEAAARTRGDIAFGFRLRGELDLAPGRAQRVNVGAGDRIVAITRLDGPRASLASQRTSMHAPRQRELSEGMAALESAEQPSPTRNRRG
jgi:ion channel POLLUX/CASTOR